MPPQEAVARSNAADEIRDSQRTSCCIVGGGPGGMMLALLLARRGVPVTLLEAHNDFDREFRGDTIHPGILEILNDIGLADRLHELPHVKVYGPTFITAQGPFQPINFRQLKTRYPYIMFMHQPVFLEFLAAECKTYPHFRLVMNASVQRLVEENGVVQGVHYRSGDGWHEVRALLTVGADGRFSRVRHLAGFKTITTSPKIELLWFRLPRLAGDPPASIGASPRFGPAGLMIVIDRFEHWQIGFFLPTGHYQEIHAAGLDNIKRRIVELEPRFARHAEHLTNWQQLSFLSVASSRCPRWHKSGLLIIGDAAHTMTPAAGAGIKYAIEDAVVTANLLAEPLKAGHVTARQLAEIQRRREWPTRMIQAFGAVAVKQMQSVLRSRATLRIPALLRFIVKLPILRYWLAHFAALGFWRVHVDK